MTESGIVYRVDDGDKIVFVNEEWDRFAAENDGETATSTHVVNRPLWDFVADSTTRELYFQMLQRIRKGGAFRFSFRCDSPACRRLLAMEIGRCEDGTVEFRTHTVMSEPRQPVPWPATSSADPEDLVACGWCKKLFVDGTWEEIEVAAERLQLFHRAPLPLMSHGICEACYESMIVTLAQS